MIKYLIVWIIFLLLGCSSKQLENRIFIEIDQSGEYLIDKNEVQKEELRSYLTELINGITRSGYKPSEVVVEIRAHPETKMGEVSYLEVILKGLRIKKIVYGYSAAKNST